MNIPYIMKRCTKCGEWKVASSINFYKSKGSKYGLGSYCKECKKGYDKQWQQTNRDRKTENNKKYYENNKEKIAEHKKQYCENNKEKIAEHKKQYYQDNKERIAENNKQYRENNKEKIAEQKKQYFQTPQGQVVAFNCQQRRRLKEEQQGSGITKDQWLEMMKFFDFRCAYSGEYLGGKDNQSIRSIDHIVPLNSNGDNMIWNCVPMLRNLNSSKNSKDMLEWYKEQDFYNPKRLAKIYEWQEHAYNKWGKDSEYFNTNDI